MSDRQKKRRREFYYREAQREGYRSRASYKLIQIHEKFNIFKSGNLVLDVGAAPGGWSQVASNYIKPNGRVYAVDLEYIEPIDNVIAIRGDISDPGTQERIKILLTNPVDIVICDISPKITGNWTTDHARQIFLAEETLRLSISGLLKQGGKFICKLFMGDLYETYLSNVKILFHVVYNYKPKASRKGSAEVYVIAKGLKKGPIKWKKKSTVVKGEEDD
ncbi:MAG TPA: RlmE family RNA methyltransferase [Candidatus Bathyarchaeia archaeon]|nr:RlmE family RNA methyltransferase [Candidatus Bathyarchaeia archaeon]